MAPTMGVSGPLAQIPGDREWGGATTGKADGGESGGTIRGVGTGGVVGVSALLAQSLKRCFLPICAWL